MSQIHTYVFVPKCLGSSAVLSQFEAHGACVSAEVVNIVSWDNSNSII